MDRASFMMRGYSIGCLIVLSAGQLIGIITTSDLLSQIGRGVARRRRAKTDTAIHHRVVHVSGRALMVSGRYRGRPRKVFAFLRRPGAYGLPVASTIERIDTHISLVYLAGPRAYKLKRAVKFDYVDFSTLEARRAACEAEVRLNRRSAPSLYVGVCPMTRERDGRLALRGTRTPVEWVVEMVRFDQTLLFDKLAAHGCVQGAGGCYGGRSETDHTQSVDG